MKIDASFHLAKDESLSFKYHIERLYPFFQQLHTTDPYAKDLLLGAKTLKEALLYPVYDADGRITNAAEAVLETKFKKETVRSFRVWNGEQEYETGLSSSYHFDDSQVIPCTFELDYYEESVHRLGGYAGVLKLVSSVVEILRPVKVTVAPQDYFLEHQVFKDRPGVGWMLYLPRVLTVQQVPEARALVPIMDGKNQIGTVVVSVTDGDFDSKNPEHIKIANAIETRLVDQDLLPRFADL